jgi:putative colanic acid biosynthesis UDP-glucose lipid carrier transferase
LSLTKEYYGEIIGLNLWNPEDSLLNYKVKRISDFFISLILLIFTSPILLLTSIAIKLTSKGPIIFKQSRYGLNGKSFIMFKFRTMYFQEKNSKKIIQAKFNDKRITKVGRFIRKYCIDELPQLINVIKGEMSLVGPRPHAVEHNEYYRKLITGYMQRHSKLPGMTGLAQINGARGETSNIELMKKRIKYDIEYNNNWDLGKDFLILIRTFFTVLNGRSF